jgi:uncharacterized protein YndB with AHSA1/START domain
MSARERSSTDEHEFTITRIFDAPRDLVFKAWRDPRYVAGWWGPQGFITTFCKIDFRVGGTFHYCMRSPDSKEYWNKGEYLEIDTPERIVNTMYFSDADGNFVEPSSYGMTDFPRKMLDIVTFAVHDAVRTKLILRRNHAERLAERYQEVEGWNQSLDRFAEVLAHSREIET